MTSQSLVHCFVTFFILIILIYIILTAVAIFVLDDVDNWAEKGSARAACNRSTTTSSGYGPDFELAKQESFGFFDDIGSSDWNMLKDKVRAMSPNFNTWYLPHVDSEGIPRGDNRNRKPGYFYQNHYEPDFVCQYERRIGKVGDGGKWICDPHRIAEQEECLVYSVGSNNDFSFEEAVLREIGPHCEIHTFDFGNYAAGAEKVGTRLHEGVNKTAVVYHQVGVGLDEPPKFKSLKTIVEELGHVNRTVDIFKIDCEGCEWETSPHWFEAPVFLRQVQVELHKSDVQATPKFFDLMYEHDYVITHKEPNIAYSGPKNLAIEYAFLKLDPAFNHGFERPKGAASQGRL
mmetsp:Transcript_2170/g.3655  ORF Transcript_2170/g.3655 Transcript_2170/m.3655 type:complete len:346 (-) Transcript_2170:210-1247(-)